MKTHVIPWMSEEETERFMAELKNFTLKTQKKSDAPTPAAPAPSAQSPTPSSGARALNLGGL